MGMRWFLAMMIVAGLCIFVTRWTIELGLTMVNETNASAEIERKRAAEAEERYRETGLLPGPDQPGAQPYRPLPQYHPCDPQPEAATPEPEPASAPSETAPIPSKPSPARPIPPAAAPPPKPVKPPGPATPYTGPTFTVGSTMAQVEAIQGRPSGRSDLPGDHQYRWWGTAVVQFHHGLVESWQDEDGVLHALRPRPAAVGRTTN